MYGVKGHRKYSNSQCILHMVVGLAYFSGVSWSSIFPYVVPEERSLCGGLGFIPQEQTRALFAFRGLYLQNNVMSVFFFSLLLQLKYSNVLPQLGQIKPTDRLQQADILISRPAVASPEFQGLDSINVDIHLLIQRR